MSDSAASISEPAIAPPSVFQPNHRIAISVLLTLGCFAAARAGMASATVANGIALISPSTGLALGAVLLFGYRMLPAVMLGELLALASSSPPPAYAILSSLGTVAQAGLGAYLLKKVIGSRFTLCRVHHVVAFMVFAVALAAMLGATIGTAGYIAGGRASWHLFGNIWRLLWSSNALGALIVAPLILIWTPEQDFRATRWQAFEGVMMLLSTLAVGGLVYGGWVDSDLVSPFSFAVLPVVIWGALRLGQTGAATTTALAVGLTVWGTLRGNGPFVDFALNVRLPYLYGFSVVLGVTGLLLGAAITERRLAVDELKRAGRDLENRVRERTKSLQTELTERMRAEEALRLTEARFRAIFEHAGIGIALIGLDGTILQSNAALENILGYASGELHGIHIADISHRDDAAPELQYLVAATRDTRITPYRGEKRYLRKNGDMVWGQLTATVFRDSAGTILYGLGMFEDVTERKHSDQEREQLLHELREALLHVKTLSGLVPICSSCKKIRDDTGFWMQVERYVAQHTDAQFSHGICPDCMKALYPEYANRPGSPGHPGTPENEPPGEKSPDGSAPK